MSSRIIGDNQGHVARVRSSWTGNYVLMPSVYGVKPPLSPMFVDAILLRYPTGGPSRDLLGLNTCIC